MSNIKLKLTYYETEVNKGNISRKNSKLMHVALCRCLCVGAVHTLSVQPKMRAESERKVETNYSSSTAHKK